MRRTPQILVGTVIFHVAAHSMWPDKHASRYDGREAIYGAMAQMVHSGPAHYLSRERASGPRLPKGLFA
jgi:hypothetical protein